MSAIIFTGTPTSTQNKVPTASLTTLERLILWCLMLYDSLNNGKDVPLIAGNTVKQSSRQIFLGKDGNLYMGFTVFLAVTSDYEIQTGQPWTFAVEQNTAKGGTGYDV